jgi:hypothetical protein
MARGKTNRSSGNAGFQVDTKIISNMKYHQYRIIASQMFEWTGLPYGLESEELELMLIDKNSVGFFNCIQGQYILPCVHYGINVYGKPTNVRPVPFNGRPLTPAPLPEGVFVPPLILWDNSAHASFDQYLRHFSKRLAEVQKSIQIIEEKMRVPTVLATTEDNELSVTSLVSKIRKGDPVIVVDEALGDDIAKTIQALDMGVRVEILKALWEDYNKIEGEIYALLGTMFNVEQNKASGVGQAETVVNFSQTFAIANSRLRQRQNWCNKVNELYKLGIWCEKAHDIKEVISEMMNQKLEQPGEASKEDEPDDEERDTQ